ncbi:MAG: YlmC/YmxH family sporulation protein [Clostridia bacterium]|nr:YlmC/YmxH family sporulation protein [Clostridia bacterium]
MELSFCCLRNKEVINVCDGKKLGNIVDLVFDTMYAKVIGIVVPSEKGIINLFKPCNDLFIPYNRICKIGKDIILVELTQRETCNTCSTNESNHHNINIKGCDICE